MHAELMLPVEPQSFQCPATTYYGHLSSQQTPVHDVGWGLERGLPGVAGRPILAGLLTVTRAADLAGRVIHI